MEIMSSKLQKYVSLTIVSGGRIQTSSHAGQKHELLGGRKKVLMFL
jgi:hypothetical protein